MSKEYFYTGFCVGQPFPDQIGQPDHNTFDLSNSGLVLFMVLDNPTPHEIQQISSKDRCIRMTCFPDCLWMTFRFGRLGWADAPYSPHLSKQANLPMAIQNACDNISIVLVDSRDGITKYCDHVPLSREFAAAFRTGISLLLSREFDKDEYDVMLNLVQSQYSAEQIANAAVIESTL